MSTVSRCLRRHVQGTSILCVIVLALFAQSPTIAETTSPPAQTVPVPGGGSVTVPLPNKDGTLTMKGTDGKDITLTPRSSTTLDSGETVTEFTNETDGKRTTTIRAVVMYKPNIGICYSQVILDANAEKPTNIIAYQGPNGAQIVMQDVGKADTTTRVYDNQGKLQYTVKASTAENVTTYTKTDSTGKQVSRIVATTSADGARTTYQEFRPGSFENTPYRTVERETGSATDIETGKPITTVTDTKYDGERIISSYREDGTLRSVTVRHPNGTIETALYDSKGRFIPSINSRGQRTSDLSAYARRADYFLPNFFGLATFTLPADPCKYCGQVNGKLGGGMPELPIQTLSFLSLSLSAGLAGLRRHGYITKLAALFSAHSEEAVQ